MSDEELLKTYRASFNKAMDEASARDGFASNMSRESIVAGLRAVFDMSKGEKRAEWEAEQGETEWEYIAQFGHVQGEERITAEAAIQSAREVLDDYPLDFPESELPMQVLRRPLVGWLPVPSTTNNESEDKR